MDAEVHTLDLVRYILLLTWNIEYSVQFFICKKHTTYHYNTEMQLNTEQSIQMFPVILSVAIVYKEVYSTTAP